MKLSRLLAGCLLPVVLVSCSDPDDPDAGGTLRIPAAGVAVDGYLAGATVFADLDNDGQRDAFEPQAFTDAFGFYSRRPALVLGGATLAARDYCALGPERHCLRLPAGTPPARTRIRGGFDLATGEAFEGELSRYLEFSGAASQTSFAITPLTSVQPDAFDNGDDTADFFDDSNRDNNSGGTFQATRARLALRIHAVVQRLASRIIEIAGLNADTDAARNTRQRLPAVIRRELALLLVAQPGTGLSAKWDALDAAEFQTLSDRVRTALGFSQSVTGVGNDLFAFRGVISQAGTDTREDVDSELLAINVYSRALAGGTAVDSANHGSRFNTLRSGIAARSGNGDHRRLDRRRLAERFNDSADTLADLNDAVVEDFFPSLAGKKLTVNDQGGNGSVVLYFSGDAGDREGVLNICATGLDEVDVNDFGDDPSLLIGGRWALPTPRTLVLGLEAFGGTFKASAALRLRPTTSGGPFQFAFDYADESEALELARGAGLESQLSNFTSPITCP